MAEFHTPVLRKEVLRYLNPQPGKNYIDATAGGGGHAIEILKAIQPGGRLLAIEWDEELFTRLKERFQKECSRFSKNYELRQASYGEIAKLVRSLNFSPAAGVLFDLGLSSFHLEESRRGFSFQKAEPLDMRYSRDLAETAARILALRNRKELESIFKNFGDERFSRSIAGKITETRRHQPIRTTVDLVLAIRRATPRWYHKGRIHFATRTFQALRIAVNREFENISRGLEAAAEILAPSGRIVVISFHYKEDAIVKNFFRQEAVRSGFKPLLGKPLKPGQSEIAINPRARSALLRAYEKIG